MDAIHALEQKWGQKSDHELWVIAQKEDRIVISKDEDFFLLASRPEDEGRLLWIRLGNCRTSDLITHINRNWSEITDAFVQNQRIVELR